MKWVSRYSMACRCGRDVVVLHLEGLALSCLPLPLTLLVCMAAHSNEVMKNVRNAMLMLK